MADNLSFDITADSTKARAELALMESSLRKTRRELKSFADEANKTGDTTKLTKVTQEIQRTEKAYASLKKEVRGTREEAEGFFERISHAAHGNRPVARLAREFGNLSVSMETASLILGRFTGGFAGGLAAAAAFKGFELLRDTVNEVSKSLGELRATAGEIGIKPIQLQGAQRAVGAIGEEADVATKMLQGMNAQIEELRKNAPKPGGPGYGSAFGVEVSAGGQSAGDLSKPLQMLHIEGQLAAITASRTQGLERQMIILRAFVQQARNLDPTALNIISKGLFGGLPSSATVAAARAQIKTLEEEIDNLKKSSAGATDAIEEDDKKLRASKDAMSNSFSLWASMFANALRGPQTAFNNFFAKGLANVPDEFQKILDALTDKWKSFWKNTGQISASADLAPAVPSTTLPDIQAGGSLPPPVYYGPGRGADSGHGPPSGDTGTAGHGPGSRATQSLTPGTSDYQGAMANVISPLSSFSDEVVAASKASASAADHIAALASSADAAAKSVTAWVSQMATPSNPTSTGFAGGGLVRGPGTGTSDSILARLSAGEFVVNSARVRQVGLGFLHRLNGFATGGLVSPSPLRFAEGGLVSAGSGGRAVHLHLGSSSFALSGSGSVVNSLVREASGAQMRSTGVKPSWFASRPSGQ